MPPHTCSPGLTQLPGSGLLSAVPHGPGSVSPDTRWGRSLGEQGGRGGRGDAAGVLAGVRRP